MYTAFKLQRMIINRGNEESCINCFKSFDALVHLFSFVAEIQKFCRFVQIVYLEAFYNKLFHTMKIRIIPATIVIAPSIVFVDIFSLKSMKPAIVAKSGDVEEMMVACAKARFWKL